LISTNDPFEDPSPAATIAIFIVNGLVYLINYIGFVVVNFSIDLLLVASLKRTLREKREKFGLKETKEDEEAVTRLVHMAIFYALANLTFKLLNSITSLNDFVVIMSNIGDIEIGFYHTIHIRYFDFVYFMRNVCSATKVCQVLSKYGHLLYLFSLTFNFVFFYNFDKKFNLAFKNIFTSSVQTVGKQRNTNLTKKTKN
jgi:hypothetical protein